jgi:hypothetical protein
MTQRLRAGGASKRDRHAPRGMRMIEAELRQHGVPRDVIEEYRAEHRAPERRPEDAAVPSELRPNVRPTTLARHLRGRPLPDRSKGPPARRDVPGAPGLRSRHRAVGRSAKRATSRPRTYPRHSKPHVTTPAGPIHGQERRQHPGGVHRLAARRSGATPWRTVSRESSTGTCSLDTPRVWPTG